MYFLLKCALIWFIVAASLYLCLVRWIVQGWEAGDPNDPKPDDNFGKLFSALWPITVPLAAGTLIFQGTRFLVRLVRGQ